MEFRCRLATAAGQVSEGTFVADSEAALRRELEEKGLYVLDLRAARKGFAGLTRSRGGRIKQHEFLVFNQELATLLKAGMPLVQSLEILRRNIPNPTSRRCSTTCTTRCDRGPRCRTRLKRTPVTSTRYTRRR